MRQKVSDHDICPICNRIYELHRFRCEPATDLELAKIRRARETGKAPKPSWYTVPKLPTARVHSIKQKYPAYVLAMFTTQSDTFRGDQFIAARLCEETDAKKYIRAYEKLCGLKPCKVTWVKTEGNFA